jgi:hypothetical protein
MSEAAPGKGKPSTESSGRIDDETPGGFATRGCEKLDVGKRRTPIKTKKILSQ